MLEIPTVPSEPYYTQVTTLDGVDYVLTFSWNRRDFAWYLTLSDQDEVVIRSGIKLVTDFPLLRRVLDARRPPGEIVVIDVLGEGSDPSFSGLGSRYRLLYVSQAELTAAV